MIGDDVVIDVRLGEACYAGAASQSARIDVGTRQGGTLGARVHASRDVT